MINLQNKINKHLETDLLKISKESIEITNNYQADTPRLCNLMKYPLALKEKSENVGLKEIKPKDFYQGKKSVLQKGEDKLAISKIFNKLTYSFLNSNAKLSSTEEILFKKRFSRIKELVLEDNVALALQEQNGNKEDLSKLEDKEEIYFLTLRINKYFFILTKFMLDLKYSSFSWNIRLFMPKRFLTTQPFVEISYMLRNLKKTSILRVSDILAPTKVKPKGNLKKIKMISLAQKKLIANLLKEGILIIINLNFLILKKKELIKNIYKNKYGNVTTDEKLEKILFTAFKEETVKSATTSQDVSLSDWQEFANSNTKAKSNSNVIEKNSRPSPVFKKTKTIFEKTGKHLAGHASLTGRTISESKNKNSILTLNKKSYSVIANASREEFKAPNFNSLPISLIHYEGLEDKPLNLSFGSVSESKSEENKKTLVQRPILSHYLKEMSKYNMRSKGIFIFYYILIGFHFNKESNKFFTSGKNIYKLLEASFKSMYCLISKPVFITTPDKIVVQLFYYLIIPNVLKLKKFFKLSPFKRKTNANRKIKGIYKFKPNYQKNKNKLIRKNQSSQLGEKILQIKPNKEEAFKRKKSLKKQYNKFRKIKFNVRVKLRKLSNISLAKVFPNKFKFLSLILNNIFKKPVEFDLIRTHYPYYDSNILVNLLGIMINKIKLRMIIRRFFEKAIIKNINNLKQNRDLLIPAFVSGLTIRLAGRLLTHRIVPRKTVKTTKRGASATGKVNFKDIATYTNKNKRGAFSITVKAGHNFF